MNPSTDLRYRIFAGEYVNNGQNGKRAAIAAGYSARSAEMQASRLLRNDKVQGFLAEFIQPTLDRYALTVENTLKHLAALAYSNKRDVASWGTTDGKPWYHPKNSDELTEDEALSVTGFKFKAKQHPARYDSKGNLVEQEYYDIETTVEQSDKATALGILAKYQGITPTTGKVRINVDTRQQTLNQFSLAGLTREEILAIALSPEE
jgi:phage terminase small subunit